MTPSDSALAAARSTGGEMTTAEMTRADLIDEVHQQQEEMTMQQEQHITAAELHMRQLRLLYGEIAATRESLERAIEYAAELKEAMDKLAERVRMLK